MRRRKFVIIAYISAMLLTVSCRSAKSISTLDEKKFFSVNGVTFAMIRVDGGTFLMGATPEQGQYVEFIEKPIHQVTVDGFYIAETEVTQELWEAVMGYNPSRSRNAQNPVENMTWDDCKAFLDKINHLTGQNFRLPTEAEWEFAARGGNKSKGYKYSGSNDIDEVAWYCDSCKINDIERQILIRPVKTKKPNELGIYDMNGNVYEFCQDCYVDYDSENLINPSFNFSECNDRVIRGGSSATDAISCRVSNRNSVEQTEHYGELGLRLAL